MTTIHYPLATSSWDEREYAAIQRVTASGRLTMGDEVAAFERAFAAHVGAEHAIMVNSGSSANLLMVAALCYHSTHRLRPGDEVLVPAVSWSTTYTPPAQYALPLRFVDIDPHTLNIDIASLEDAITDRTRLLLAVNLLGNPNDFAALKPLLDRHDILLIEDNCESLGAALHGRQAGTFGLAGSYSCFFSHHISTMEGGLVVTDDAELHHIMLSLRAHGWTRDLPHHNHVTGTKSTDPFTESFRFVLPGYNLRPLEIAGAIGREQLRKLPAIIRARRANARIFREVMAHHPDLRIQRETGASSWFGFSLIIHPDSSLTRPALIKALTRAGIEYRPIVAGNFTRNPVVANHIPHTIHGPLTHADHLDRNGLFIGNHHYPLEQQMDRLDSALTSLTGS
ncbi:MAG: DegT/DnrJ/EryC1/StrS family aminotransferase [Rhodobacteraceae bacterium]|nr:DegT/DnrJ/EryC1/StrS family aminotransferase [Paracoccaceae bacterium]